MSWQVHNTPDAPAGAAEPAEAAGGQWWRADDAQGLPLAWLHAQPRMGNSRLRYSFHIGRVVHAAPELGLHHVQHTLQIGHDATGEAELSALHAAPNAPPEALSALLRAALGGLRAARPDKAWVMVELPGWLDAQGESPFWQGLVRHFLPADTRSARLRLGPAFSSHLGPMLPRQLIHVGFLPPDTQASLGQPGAAAGPWLAALAQAGFADWRHLRLEDGGPIWARPLQP
jgi:arginine/ornithine N-succinyltransferase beta subunit